MSCRTGLTYSRCGGSVLWNALDEEHGCLQCGHRPVVARPVVELETFAWHERGRKPVEAPAGYLTVREIARIYTIDQSTLRGRIERLCLPVVELPNGCRIIPVADVWRLVQFDANEWRARHRSAS